MEDSYAIIMVGGPGKRLWPLSTKEIPKPFLPLITNKALIEETFERIIDIFPLSQIRFVLQEDHKNLVSKIFPFLTNKNYIIEPEGRDTAAAICLALSRLPKNPNVVVLSSDHYISDKGLFQKGILSGIKFLKEAPNFVLLFGILPKRAETGYGYIKKGKELIEIDGIKISKISKFIEKPSLRRARAYIKNKDYFWNAGIFIFKKDRMSELFLKYLPKHFKIINEGDIGGFKKLEKISIDYGIIEHVKTVGMIEANFLWDDIGNYESLIRLNKKDSYGNLIFGAHEGIDTRDCIIYSKGAKIKTIGVKNMVIAYKDGNILVACRDKVSEIKKLI